MRNNLQSVTNGFPNPDQALASGILGYGGDLSVKRLIQAYKNGIFPYYEVQPILWWSPDPRSILFPKEFRISKSLRREIKKKWHNLTLDRHFESVMRFCGETPRKDNPQNNTWINEEMVRAYIQLNEAGYAHSIEIHEEGRLVGGLYGVCFGNVFFGESMFHTRSNASKVALAYLVALSEHLSIGLIDCQFTTDHLIRLGAEEISRRDFLQKIATLQKIESSHRGKWHQYESINLSSLIAKKTI